MKYNADIMQMQTDKNFLAHSIGDFFVFELVYDDVDVTDASVNIIHTAVKTDMNMKIITCLLRCFQTLRTLRLTTNDFDMNFYMQLKKVLNSMHSIANKKYSKTRVIYHIVNNDEIADLNFRYYKKIQQPTDILTFPYFDVANKILGEIFINPSYVKKKAIKRGEPQKVYCYRLCVHGFLHLIFGKHSHEFDRVEELLLKAIVPKN